MKLHVTSTSPYARFARIMVIEKGLADRVEIIRAQTRTPESPYFKINPSGRVPYLVRRDGVGMEDSLLICAYLDHLDGNPQFDPPSGPELWEYGRLEALARSLMDGLSVWLRELHRPENERSPTIIAHEEERGVRLANIWEKEVQNPLLSGALNLVQITLLCALQLEKRLPELNWRAGHPNLCAWEAVMATRPSFAQTEPGLPL